MHVDEDFAQAPVVELAGAQVHLVAADIGLLGVALAAVGQLFAFAGDALDDLFDDLFGDLRHAGHLVGGEQGLDGILLLVVLIGEERGVERLATAWSRRDRARWP